MKQRTVNIILIVIVVLMVFAPLYLQKGAEFGGADSLGMDIVTEINPNYSPWIEPLMEPASGEIEGLFFALQAAIGSGIVFGCIGYMIGKSKREKAE